MQIGLVENNLVLIKWDKEGSMKQPRTNAANIDRSISKLLSLFFLLSIYLNSMPLHAANLSSNVRPKAVVAKRTNALERFVSYIWQHNPTIQSAQSNVARAEAEFSQSRKPLYNPSLDLEAEHIRREPQENTYTAGLSQTIDLFDKRGARAKVGQYGLAESKANLRAQQLSLATETLKALAEYRTAQKIVVLAKRRTKLLYRFRELNVRKFKSGDIAQDALDQAALAYAEAISQQANEEITLTTAKQHLMATAQTVPGRWPQLPHRLPKPLQPSRTQQQQWLQRLPLIHVYNARVAIALATIRVARTETKSDPTLSVRGGTEDKEALVGVGVNIPIFVRNNFRDQVRAANHQAIAVEKTRMNIFRHSKATLQGELSRYRILYDATRRWDQASKHSLDGGIDLLNRLWTAGELNTTNYLVQLKQRIDSQIAGVELNGKAWQSWFSVMEASGRLTSWLPRS